MIISVLLA